MYFAGDPTSLLRLTLHQGMAEHFTLPPQLHQLGHVITGHGSQSSSGYLKTIDTKLECMALPTVIPVVEIAK